MKTTTTTATSLLPQFDSRSASPGLPILLAMLFATGHGVAQCTNVWHPLNGSAVLNGSVFQTMPWDPDGPGPAAQVLVVAGDFTQVGPLVCNRIAVLDLATGAWSALGSGLGSLGPGLGVHALAILGNGDLVAGGWFTSAGGVPANFIARWNGTSWSALGSGVNGPVHAFAKLANGDLVAGGAGGSSGVNIARWNGTSWSALGGGTDDVVYALATLPNGDLVAGGAFFNAGGVSANHIA
ncbi:MAG: hypothetical protein JNK15_05715, partial [Planctomycetes bacterium]|nr:hypothetical protein [Planctomycetota bacterium]